MTDQERAALEAFAHACREADAVYARDLEHVEALQAEAESALQAAVAEWHAAREKPGADSNALYARIVQPVRLAAEETKSLHFAPLSAARRKRKAAVDAAYALAASQVTITLDDEQREIITLAETGGTPASPNSKMSSAVMHAYVRGLPA